MIEEEVVVALEAVVASAETEVAAVASAADVAVDVAVDAVVASAAAAEIVADVAALDAAVVVVELEAVLAQALRSSSSLTHVSPAFTFNAAKMMFF